MTLESPDARPFRDELAEARAARDRAKRQREPAARRALYVALDALDTSITALECPVCLGPVFATADSHVHGDRIDCAECDARLVAHRTSDGELTAMLFKAGAP